MTDANTQNKVELTPENCIILKHIPAKRLNAKHNLYILQQVANFRESRKEITAELADPEVAAQYGFEPIVITHQRVSQIILKLDPDKLREKRHEYLTDFSTVPLAHKKMRVMELISQYDKLELKDPKEGTNTVQNNLAEIVRLRLAVLKQIKDEIGEDLDKLMEALRDGNRPLNIQLSHTQLIQVGMLLQSEGQLEEAKDMRIGEDVEVVQ